MSNWAPVSFSIPEIKRPEGVPPRVTPDFYIEGRYRPYANDRRWETFRIRVWPKKGIVTIPHGPYAEGWRIFGEATLLVVWSWETEEYLGDPMGDPDDHWGAASESSDGIRYVTPHERVQEYSLEKEVKE
jgi:hypothetical protein